MQAKLVVPFWRRERVREHIYRMRGFGWDFAWAERKRLFTSEFMIWRRRSQR